MIEDFYKLFGISKNASKSEITEAFRKLAHQYYPDKSKDPDANEKFQGIKTAYSILSDPYSRSVYDSVLSGKVSTSEYEQVKTEAKRKSAQKQKAGFWEIVDGSFSINSRLTFSFLLGFAGIGFVTVLFVKDSLKDWVETYGIYESRHINEYYQNEEKEYLITMWYVYDVHDQKYKVMVEEVIGIDEDTLAYEPVEKIELYYNRKNPNEYVLNLDGQITFGMYLAILLSIAIGMRIMYSFMKDYYRYSVQQ